jgi:NADH-quinone oxidoreductase subunit L
MKITFATFAIGMMALSGVPFLFSGFWSKEAILHAAHAWDVSPLPLYAGLAAVVLTAFYMTRLVAETFLGQPRSAAAEHAHENSAVMTIPLILLALGAIGLGFLGTPAYPWLQARLSGTELHSSLHHLMEGSGLMLLSIGLVGVGLGLGWWLYGRQLRTTAEARDPLVVAAPRVMAALANRLGFDELYAATVGRLNHFTAMLAQGIDRWVLGGLVNFLAQLGIFSGTVNRQLDEDGLNSGFDQISASVRGSGQRYAQAQTGEAHGYLRVMAVAFIVLALVLVLGGAR